MIEQRSGFDQGLRWHIYSGMDLTNADRLRAAVRDLPEDGIILIEDLPADITQQQLRDEGYICHLSPLDMGYLLAGPLQKARARTRHEGYRMVGVPA